MRRRPPRILGVAAIAVVLLAACGGPAGPTLTDPTEIVTAALKATDAATSVHADATLDGTLPIALPGLGGGGPVEVSGTTATADLDLVAPAAHATFIVPTLFNLNGELIATGGQGYVKTSLTGDKYQVVDLSTLPIDVTNVHALIDRIGDALLSGKVTLMKGPDVACGSGQCYTVTADITGERLGAMLPGVTLPPDISSATGTIAITVETAAPNRLHGIHVELSPAGDGSPTIIDVVFSDWDKPVTVSAPPADQVKGG